MNRISFQPVNMLIACLKVLLALLIILAGIAIFPGLSASAAAITVDSTADTTIGGDNACTLREAIANANTDTDTTSGDCTDGNGTDTISFDPSVFQGTITLNGTELSISSDLTIDGPPSGITLDGNAASRVFIINSGTVILNNLIITNGNVTGSGGQSGGGIRNLGTLTINKNRIENSNVTSTDAGAFGGGIVNGSGAILVVSRSTISNNTVTGGGGSQSGGGGISNSGVTTLNNSTVSGNSAGGSSDNNNGGGIRNAGASSTFNINNSTIVNNATSGVMSSNGGGISNGGNMTLNNDIVANNTASTQGSDCRGAVTAINNLIGNQTNCTITGSGNLSGNPLLGPLEANGGGNITMLALTHYPLDTSPVLNSGNNATCLSIDQRGNPRPVGTCDMGAVEKQTGEQTDQHCTWSSGVPHAFGTDVNITITPNTSDNPGCITVLKRPVFAGITQDDGEFPSVWTLSAENSTYNLNLQFCYSDTELATAGVSDETSIVVFHLQSGIWQPLTTATNPVNNCVTVSNVTSLSPWTMVGNGNVPTAIELQNLTAQAGNSTQSMVLVFAALLGLALGLALLRLRK